nr:hypothetical protein [Tanacetum cinerariifolium]
ANHRLYHALMEALIEDENAMDKGVADTIKNDKRKHHDDDEDEDPPAGPNEAKITKRRITKESESFEKASTTKETPKGKAPSKGFKAGKYASVKEPVEEPIAEVVMDDAGEDVVHDDDQPQDTSEPKTTKTPNLKWESNNGEKGVSFGTINKFSKHNVYSIQKILGVKSVSVKKLHGYDNLEEIVVKRADCQLYKFKEGDFVDLHLSDIEDMLLRAVQHKLFHLNESDIFDFIVALRMFTRTLVIKNQVEDLQLGIKSYQKKLNITVPQKTFPEIEFKGLYTPSYKPPGEIYKDLNK